MADRISEEVVHHCKLKQFTARLKMQCKRNDEMVKLQHLTLIFIEHELEVAFICLWARPFIHIILLITSKVTSIFSVNQYNNILKHMIQWGTITIPPTCRPLMKFSTEKSWYRKMSRSSWKTLDPNLNGYSDVINIWSRQNRYFKFLTKNWKFKLLSIPFYCMAIKLIYK